MINIDKNNSNYIFKQLQKHVPPLSPGTCSGRPVLRCIYNYNYTPILYKGFTFDFWADPNRRVGLEFRSKIAFYYSAVIQTPNLYIVLHHSGYCAGIERRSNKNMSNKKIINITYHSGNQFIIMHNDVYNTLLTVYCNGLIVGNIGISEIAKYIRNRDEALENDK